MALPKVGCEIALNMQMVQVQLDDRNTFRKIAPDVIDSNVQSGNSAALALRCNHHRYLPFNARSIQSRESGWGIPPLMFGNRSVRSSFGTFRMEGHFG